MLSVPSVDIVIPVFNDPEGLGRCLEALAAHSHSCPDFRVVVVDNASTPPLKIQKQYPFSFQLITCQTPGSYAARNAGASVSDGDVLVFLDADCIPQAGWLANGLQALSGGESERVIGGQVLFLSSENPTATEAYQLIVGFGQEKNINAKGFTATANLFVSRKTFMRVGFFDETLLSGGDREWCWRAAAAGAPVFFANNAVVITPPRRKLRSAIVQARRIAGGRHSLLSDDVNRDIDIERVLPESSLSQKLKVVFADNGFSRFVQLKVLGVAVILLVVRKFEAVRLKVGGERERR